MRRGITYALLILTVAAVVALAGEDGPDFYDILELKDREDATQQQIKSNFRKLSRQHHPDLKGESHRDKYQQIQRAYEVLSDRRKRKVYDMKGEEGLQKLEQQQNTQHQHDPFMGLFGMRDNSKGRNVEMMLMVSLADIYTGASHTMQLSKQKLCKTCRGTGAASKSDLVVCKACKGKGVTLQKVQLAPGFVQQVQNTCPHCNGQGKVIKRKCNTCKGAKVVRGDVTLDIEIEQGMPDNHKMVFEMEADQTPDVLPGDVILVVQSSPHQNFRRHGNDLELTVKLTLREALTGIKRMVKHLDDHEVEIERTGVTQHGTKMTIKGEGMPIHNVPSERGDLVVLFEVVLPTSLTEHQKTELKSILLEAQSN